MTPYEHERATKELVLAMNPGSESSRDVRLADWAEKWGIKLLEAAKVEANT